MADQLHITDSDPVAELPTRWEFHVMGQPVPWQRTGGYGKRRYTPTKTRDYQKTVSDIAKIRRPRGWPFRSKDVLFRMEVYVFHKDRRRRDNDNCCKSIKDALNEIAYVDDYQVQQTYVQWAIDRENPRAEIILEVLS